MIGGTAIAAVTRRGNSAAISIGSRRRLDEDGDV
jgi:hypothetical protein